MTYHIVLNVETDKYRALLANIYISNVLFSLVHHLRIMFNLGAYNTLVTLKLFLYEFVISGKHTLIKKRVFSHRERQIAFFSITLKMFYDVCCER